MCVEELGSTFGLEAALMEAGSSAPCCLQLGTRRGQTHQNKQECRSVSITYNVTFGQLILLSLLLFFYRLSASHIQILSYLLLSAWEIVCHVILSPEC